MRTMLQQAFSDSSRLEAARLALPRAAVCWHLDAVDVLLLGMEGFPDKSVTEDQGCLQDALEGALDYEWLCDYNYRQAPGKQPNTIMRKLVAAGADVHIELDGP